MIILDLILSCDVTNTDKKKVMVSGLNFLFLFFSVWLKFKLQSPKLKNESSKNVQSRLDYVGVGNFSLVKAETRRGWDIFQAEVALY